MAEDLKPEDRALFERIVPGNTSLINFDSVRISHADLVNLLDAARAEGLRPSVLGARVSREEVLACAKRLRLEDLHQFDRTNGVSHDWDIDQVWNADAAMPLSGPGFVAKWTGLAEAALSGLPEPAGEPALVLAMKGLMDEWHRQAEAYEKDSKKLEPATGRETARSYSALLDRVASDLKLTISSVVHGRPAPVKADTAAEGWGSVALDDVSVERRRQVEAEGWSPEHDDEHADGSLAKAAACYAVGYRIHASNGEDGLRPAWVWPHRWEWNPADRRRELVKAGALIVAEIERLDRAAPPPTEGAA